MKGKRQQFLRVTLIVTLVAAGGHTGVVAQTETPEEVVSGAADLALKELNHRRDYYEQNPHELSDLVSSIFLPRFDQTYAAYLILGRYGRSTSAEERVRFTDALYKYILNRYAHGLLQFTSERLQILPYQGSPDEERATVRTFVLLNDGRRIPVNYDLRLSGAGWRVFDITIEGVSYIRNMRSQFGAEIERNGIESVITRLQAETATLAVGDADQDDAG